MRIVGFGVAAVSLGLASCSAAVGGADGDDLAGGKGDFVSPAKDSCAATITRYEHLGGEDWCAGGCWSKGVFYVTLPEPLYDAGYRPVLEWFADGTDPLGNATRKEGRVDVEGSFLTSRPVRKDGFVTIDQKVVIEAVGTSVDVHLAVSAVREDGNHHDGETYRFYIDGPGTRSYVDPTPIYECDPYFTADPGDADAFEARGLPKALVDAAADVKGDDPYLPLCLDRDQDPSIDYRPFVDTGETEAIVEVKEGFGAATEATLFVRLRHHYPGDINVDLYRRRPGEASFRPHARLLDCESNRDGGALELRYDVSGEVLDGEWQVIVRDFDRDSAKSYSSGRNAANALEAVKLVVVRAE